MTRLLFIFLAIVMAAKPVHANRSKPQWTALVVIDNSSTTSVEARPEAMKNIQVFLAEMSKLRSRRLTRDIQIQIILTTVPNRLSWVGTPADLRKDAEKVLSMIEFRDTCSDIGLAFEEADIAITINPPGRLDIFALSPMIHVPFSTCGNGDVVHLPQDVPDNLLLGKLAKQAASVSLLNVHDDQKRNYLEYLNGLGLTGSFDIRGLVETSAKLSQGRILQ